MQEEVDKMGFFFIIITIIIIFYLGGSSWIEQSGWAALVFPGSVRESCLLAISQGWAYGAVGSNCSPNPKWVGFPDRFMQQKARQGENLVHANDLALPQQGSGV